MRWTVVRTAPILETADHHPAGSPSAGECTPGRGEQCSLWTSSCRQRLRGHSALGSQSRS